MHILDRFQVVLQGLHEFPAWCMGLAAHGRAAGVVFGQVRAAPLRLTWAPCPCSGSGYVHPVVGSK